MTLNTSNRGSKFEPKGQNNVKITDNENVNIVFALSKKWIDLHQTKTKLIYGSFYT